MRHIKRIIPYYKNYKLQLFGGLALVTVGSGIASVIPWLLKTGIDALRTSVQLSYVFKIGLAIVGVALFAGVCRFGMRYLLNGLSRWIEFDLRNDLFEHLLKLDASFYSRMRTGDVMARLTNDLSAVRMAAGPAIMYLTNTIFGGMFALVFMTKISGRLTLLALLPMIGIPAIAIKLGKLIHKRFEAVQEHFSTITTHAQENLSGVRIVRAYQQEQSEIAHFSELNGEYVNRNLSLVRLWGVMHPSFSFLVGIASVVVLGVGGAFTLQGTLTIGELVAFGMYLGMLTWPLIALGWVINLFQRGDASMGRLVQILDSKPLVVDSPNPRSLPSTTGGRSIEFRNVGFHYPTSDNEAPRWVLRNISFVINAGSTLGISGATGSGKTALIDLIARNYDCNEGEILIDGIPITKIPVDQLRGEIGYVTQETILFSETIRANLEYGLTSGTEEKTISWEKAAQIAQLEGAVGDFPHGYDTMLGERGINLSGGQKQRASMARALARDPAILLLDDALSAVDTHTESAILAGLKTALHGRTSVIASHRSSALKNAETIIVLDEGEIVESGTHADLVQSEGKYWNLVRKQSIKDELDEQAKIVGIE